MNYSFGPIMNIPILFFVAVLILYIVYYINSIRSKRVEPYPQNLEEDDEMDQDPTSIDESIPNSLNGSWESPAKSGFTTFDPSCSSKENMNSFQVTKSDLQIQCLKSSLLSFTITPNYIVFIYDESNDIFLYDINMKKEFKVPLERGGFATCVQSLFHTNTKDTILFLCTDTIESGYCVHRYELLTQSQKKLRRQQNNGLHFGFNTNRDLLVEDTAFRSWRHPGLICQIDCVRGRYLITRCEDNDTCFILNAEDGEVITKLSTGQYKTAMFASSAKYVVNASFMNLLKIYAFSDMIPQKEKHKSKQLSQKLVTSKQQKEKTLRRQSRDGCDTDLLYNCMGLSGHKSSVQYVCFSPMSEELVSVSNDGTIRLWTLRNVPNDNRCIIEKPLSNMMGTVQPSQCSMFLAWSPSKHWISFAFQNQIVLLHSNTLEEEYRITTTSFVTVLKWAENSKFIISGHLNGEANFWKIKPCTETKSENI